MGKRIVAIVLCLMFLGVGVVFASNGFTTSTLGSGHVLEAIPLENGEAILAVLNNDTYTVYLYHVKDGYAFDTAAIPVSGIVPVRNVTVVEAGGVVHVVIEYNDNSLMYHSWKIESALKYDAATLKR